MSELKVCDYSDYDYKTEFWSNGNRNYEHQLEISMVNQLLNKYGGLYQSILDAGCGFGRLAPAYQFLYEKCHLVDYAENLLTEAKASLQPIEQFKFYQQSLYELKIHSNVNAIISIRTLHHLNNVEPLFKNYHDCLDEEGLLILDVPNYYHLKNKIKSPFQERKPMIKLSETFYNYDPDYIIDKLGKSGFNIIGYRQVGLFRINKIKKIIPTYLLVKLELFLNKFIKNLRIAPSVYIIAKKCG